MKHIAGIEEWGVSKAATSVPDWEIHFISHSLIKKDLPIPKKNVNAF